MRRMFVVIRDKLGDSVIAFQALSAYRMAHPEDDITLMVHEHYMPLFVGERGYRFVPYHSSLRAFAWVLWQRITFRRFDVVLVLRGSGSKVAWMARLLSAKLRIHALNRYPEIFPDTPTDPGPALTSHETHIEAAMRSLRSLDPELAYPKYLRLHGLDAYRRPAEAVVICPVSDELRRTLSRDDVIRLLPVIRIRHPGKKIWILVRQSGDEGFVAGDFEGAEVRAFESIIPLLKIFGLAAAYYGVDTGLYHVAAAMGIPAVVFFGPSQPYKVVLPGQMTESVRLGALGESHCDNKECTTPACIHKVIADWSATPSENVFPERCPLSPDLRDIV
ncbi:glycosyltransferase family 9 protein [Dechloromonas denitrificans]|uniref:glycosyltransferase family 9 protein n=1 Tax=Dechloromonas denitrificans TaxID=281362 RepID=UPI0009F86F2F|nr:glycosyltransferase family 9 protein [Dechloromonas denitrificans]